MPTPCHDTPFRTCFLARLSPLRKQAMTFADLKLRVRALFTPHAVERELGEELAFHIECETRKLMAGGLGADEARRRALARFGPVPLAADRCRDERGIGFFEALARDVHFALRTLRRAPLVALTVVMTIALGLGVVTVAFTFFNAFFFRVDAVRDRKSTRLNSSHLGISYAVFCLKKKNLIV